MPRYNRKTNLGHRLVGIQRQVASQGTKAPNQRTSITSGATVVKAPDGVTDLVTVGVLDSGAHGIAVHEDGLMLVEHGGQIVAVDESGRVVALLGALIGIGKPQNGFSLQGDYDGRKYVAFALADYGTDTTQPVRSVLAQYDHNGYNIISSDIGSPLGGLASPHLGAGSGMRNSDSSTWPKTTATTWTTIEHQEIQYQNPCLQWIVEVIIGGSSTAELRMVVGGVPVGAVYEVAAGTYSYWEMFNVPLPAGTTMGGFGFVELQAQVVTGTESVAAQTIFFQGDASVTGAG